MCSTCICPTAEDWHYASSSCDSASGKKPGRDPGLKSHNPQGLLHSHSWSGNHRLPPGSSKQMEASKTAGTAGSPIIALKHGHTNPCGRFVKARVRWLRSCSNVKVKLSSSGWQLSSREEVGCQCMTNQLLAFSNPAECGFPYERLGN